jgi:DNA-binding transcriptional MocR family regulator
VGEGVLADLLRAGSEPRVISFAQAFPDPETYPVRELALGLRHALRQRDALDYGPIQGEEELRREVAALLLDRGLSLPPEHLLITSGAQQAIDMVLRALTEPGDVLLVEEPAYPGVLEAAAYSGVRVVGVPIDERGLRVDELQAACTARRPRLLYTVPTFQNPTGVVMSSDRRRAVLDLAREHDLIVLEDDPYGFLAFDGPTSPPLLSEDEDGRVVYVATFSKVLAPALRLGAIAASPQLLPRLAGAKQSTDLVSSAVLQRALADYLRRGHFREHIERMRSHYAERRAAMLAGLERHLPECLWSRPAGGLSLWVTLPDTLSERDFVRDALDAGVAVAPGRVFYPEATGGSHARLSFGSQTPERIEEGVALLGHVLRRHLGRRPRALSMAGRGVGPLV